MSSDHNPRETPDLKAAPLGHVLVGVSRAVRHDQVEHLSKADQDSLIRDVLTACETDLKRMVADVPPLGALTATVTGPHDDTIQGPIHLHNVVGYFPIDKLPVDCEAYKIHVEGVEPGAQ